MANAAAAVEFVPVWIHTRDGRRVTLHAVRVDDKDRLQAALRGLSVESRYARFMSPLHELFAQIDSPEGPTVCLVRCDLAGVS